MGAPEQQHVQAYRRPAEVDGESFARLEQQVAYNYHMIQGQHADIGRLNEVVAQMQREMAMVLQVMEQVRNDLRARPAAPHWARGSRPPAAPPGAPAATPAVPAGSHPCRR